MSDKPYSLQFELDGLSFAAKAVLSTVTALTYEFQDEEIAVRVIRSSLGLSEDAWIAARDELFEAGPLYSSGDDLCERVSLVSAADILCASMGAGGRPTGSQWRELRDETFKYKGRFCTYCGTADAELVVDHVIPVSRGGSNHPANLVPACTTCNAMKGNKAWTEWYPIFEGMRR